MDLVAAGDLSLDVLNNALGGHALGVTSGDVAGNTTTLLKGVGDLGDLLVNTKETNHVELAVLVGESLLELNWLKESNKSPLGFIQQKGREMKGQPLTQ